MISLKIHDGGHKKPVKQKEIERKEKFVTEKPHSATLLPFLSIICSFQHRKAVTHARRYDYDDGVNKSKLTPLYMRVCIFKFPKPLTAIVPCKKKKSGNKILNYNLVTKRFGWTLQLWSGVHGSNNEPTWWNELSIKVCLTMYWIAIVSKSNLLFTTAGRFFC